jgi:hypothetical protein
MKTRSILDPLEPIDFSYFGYFYTSANDWRDFPKLSKVKEVVQTLNRRTYDQFRQLNAIIKRE